MREKNVVQFILILLVGIISMSCSEYTTQESQTTSPKMM